MAKKKRKRKSKPPKAHHNPYILCGDCRNIDSCKNIYKINDFSPACIKFKPRLYDDSFINKLKRKLSSKQFFVDESVMDELKSFKVFSVRAKSIARNIRVPIANWSKRELSKLASLFEETQAYRDRTLEIRISIKSILNELISIENLARSYVYDKYRDHISMLGNQEARNAFMQRTFRPLYEIKRQLEFILDTAEMVEINLSNTHFALKEIRAIAEITLGKLLNP